MSCTNITLATYDGKYVIKFNTSKPNWIKFRIFFCGKGLNSKTMAGNLDIHAPGPFKVIGEHTNLSKSWEQYVKIFEYYLKSNRYQ